MNQKQGRNQCFLFRNRKNNGTTDWNGVQMSYDEEKKLTQIDPQRYCEYILFLFLLEEIQFDR